MKHQRFIKLVAPLTLAVVGIANTFAADTTPTNHVHAKTTMTVSQSQNVVTHAQPVDREVVARYARCNVHRNAEDIALCQRRMTHGETNGSVQGGGILRTYSETVYLKPATE